MKIDIVGAGSMGLLLAAKLADSHELQLQLIARSSEQAEKISKDGVGIRTMDGADVRRQVRCVSFPEAADELAAGDLPLSDADVTEAQWLWITTKQTHWDESLLAYILARVISGRTNLLLFQNGVGHVELLTAKGVPANRIFLAVTTEGAKKTAADEVSHTGAGITRLGRFGASDATGLAPLQNVLTVLLAAGFEAITVPDIECYIFRKLLTNSIINPLTAILRISNGELAASPYYRSVMRMLFDEAIAVLPDFGLTDPEAAWREVLDVCERTAANASSMLQDVLAGRETEIDAITGAVLKEAAARGMTAPTHAAVYALVKGGSSSAESAAEADSH